MVIFIFEDFLISEVVFILKINFILEIVFIWGRILVLVLSSYIMPPFSPQIFWNFGRMIK